MRDVLVLDGSQGEGGGQILRTALSLSLVRGQAFRLVNIRTGRRNPGLLPQHLAALRAAATIGGAIISGDRLGSIEIGFAPTRLPRPGDYAFDVEETVSRGSAGSVTLILQTLLIPLAFADGDSTLTLRGGTHVEWSPPFDHLANSYLPALRLMGIRVEAELERWGWYPVGGGEVACRICGGAANDAASWPKAIELRQRGPLRRIAGRAVAASLPAHIPQRMAERASAVLGDLGVPVDIDARQVTAACAGAGIFLVAEYQELMASFGALGRLGKPSETVADEAATALRAHHASNAAVELHLADQLLMPLALATGASAFTVARPTGHLVTNARIIAEFGVADIVIEPGQPNEVRVQPRRRR